jgi:DNA polymerase-1
VLPLLKYAYRGVVHPNFNLHIPRTFRSSSANPNFHNLPKRDDKLSYVRQAIVPTRGDYLIEADFKGAEVRVLAMLSEDPMLLDYLECGDDFHLDWARRIKEIQGRKGEEATKEERDAAKGRFVFPLFYGASTRLIAERNNLTTAQAKRLVGEFWDNFRGVRRWQQDIMERYTSTGKVSTPFGFVAHAPLSFNQVINMPIQATAFHLLLRGHVLLHEEMCKRRLLSGVIIEVHDSLVVDTFENEKDVVSTLLAECLQARSEPWEVLPMQIELSIGSNWFEMEPMR